MPIRLLLLALLATCLASTAGQAQHGTPFELRVMTPEVEDAAPGQEPAPEEQERARGLPPPTGVLSHHRSAGHHHHRHLRALPLPDPAQQHRAALRHRRRTRRLPVERAAQGHAQGGMAGLDAAGGNDRAAALSAALHGRRPGQSHGRARALSRQHGLSHPWHQRARDHRPCGVVRLLPAGQRADRRISTTA